MHSLIKNISSLVTVDAGGEFFKAGSDMSEIGEIKDGAILFGEKIEWIGTTKEAEKLVKKKSFFPSKIIDASGKTIMPGFVDSHTHIVFGGNRSHEFGKRLRGATYQEIAADGGGILTTVRGTRDATIRQLTETGKSLAIEAMKHGTTTIEIKSGYGLSTDAELKQLKAIAKLRSEAPLRIKATFMGAHDFPPEYRNNKEKYVDLLCNEMIPAVAKERYAEFCDAFIDEGYYSLKQGERILKTGLDNGLKLKVHCDELAQFGAAELAAKYGAVSADHLLFVSDEGIGSMKESGTVATLLPGTAYFIRMPYAPARKIIDNGVITALASDFNPGSCFTGNMQLIMSLAAINMRMTAEECISAATINGAHALGMSDVTGSLEVGKMADMVMYDVPTYLDIFYHFGVNHVESVWIGGKGVI
jgi:imidazolonepropionase